MALPLCLTFYQNPIKENKDCAGSSSAAVVCAAHYRNPPTGLVLQLLSVRRRGRVVVVGDLRDGLDQVVHWLGSLVLVRRRHHVGVNVAVEPAGLVRLCSGCGLGRLVPTAAEAAPAEEDNEGDSDDGDDYSDNSAGADLGA